MPILNPTLIRVAAVIAKTMHDPGLITKITVETKWQDLNADSLDRAEIFFEIETEFDCELSDGACEVVTTIGDLAALIDKAKARVSA